MENKTGRAWVNYPFEEVTMSNINPTAEILHPHFDADCRIENESDDIEPCPMVGFDRIVDAEQSVIGFIDPSISSDVVWMLNNITHGDVHGVPAEDT